MDPSADGPIYLSSGPSHCLHRLPDLPNELIFKILNYLPWRYILRSRHISRWIRDGVDQSVEFRYKVALGLSSLEDGLECGPPLTIAERLRLLDAQQQAWRNLAWRKLTTFPVPYTASSRCKLSEGILTLSPRSDMQSLHYLRLPTTEQVDNGPELKWLHINLGFEVSDFTMDVGQDLLVLIETDRAHILFHFWTLSTRVPHPAARRPIFKHPRKSWDCYQCVIRISGSHVAVLFSGSNRYEKDCLLVFSWTTGDKRGYVEAPTGGQLISFTFLSSCVLVVPSDVSLDLYSFNPKSTIDPAPILSPVVSFYFPPKLSSNFYFKCHSFPYPGGDFGHLKSDTIEIPHPTPFSTDREDGILAVWLRSFSSWSNSATGCLIVHQKALESYLDSQGDSNGVKNVDWNNWGPKNTRWLEENHDPHSGTRICTVHGHRLVMVESAADGTGGKFIVVLDFNPGVISKTLARSVASDLVTTPTTLIGGQIFNTDIHTELPYLETRSRTPFICTGAILDDQRILLIQRSEELDDGYEDFSLLLL